MTTMDKLLTAADLLKQANAELKDGLRVWISGDGIQIHVIRGTQFKELAGDRLIKVRSRMLEEGAPYPNEAYFVLNGVEFMTLVASGHEDLEDINFM